MPGVPTATPLLCPLFLASGTALVYRRPLSPLSPLPWVSPMDLLRRRGSRGFRAPEPPLGPALPALIPQPRHRCCGEPVGMKALCSCCQDTSFLGDMGARPSWGCPDMDSAGCSPEVVCSVQRCLCRCGLSGGCRPWASPRDNVSTGLHPSKNKTLVSHRCCIAGGCVTLSVAAVLGDRVSVGVLGRGVWSRAQSPAQAPCVLLLMWHPGPSVAFLGTRVFGGALLWPVDWGLCGTRSGG